MWREGYLEKKILIFTPFEFKNIPFIENEKKMQLSTSQFLIFVTLNKVRMEKKVKPFSINVLNMLKFDTANAC